MDYIRQIESFNDWLVTNSLPTSAIALWYQIMAINRKTGWAEEFTVANKTLESLTGLSRQGVDKARNVLIQKARIVYKKNGGNSAGKYKVLPFECHIVVTSVGTTVAQSESQPWRNGSTLYTTTSPPSVSEVETENLERPFENDGHQGGAGRQYPKYQPPTVEEVVSYFAENGSEPADAKVFHHKYTLDDWFNKAGHKMFNWQNTALTWIKNERQNQRRREEPQEYNPKPTTKSPMRANVSYTQLASRQNEIDR